MGMGVLASSLSAPATDNLFKNYAYAAPRVSYVDSDGYYDCSEDVGGFDTFLNMGCFFARK